MQQSRATELVTGAFVLFGFTALFFLVTQITNKDFSIVGGSGGYSLVASFEIIGSLKVGAPVSMSGFTVGRVESIAYDQNAYKAVVHMHINPTFNKIPNDSDAAIMTSGLLGGQYISVTAGGAEEFFKNGDKFAAVQDAIVLENLINKFMANMAGKSNNDGNASTSDSGKVSKSDK
jgi:phospholipid/cholesterol/gamma-HCH transport system substrate-binding protein